MAKHRMDVTTFVGKLLEAEDVDLLREGVRILAQVLMDAEVSTQIGAELYERTEDRTAQRNGYRSRTWDTRVGTVELRVPKIAPGSYFPALLEPRTLAPDRAGPNRGDRRCRASAHLQRREWWWRRLLNKSPRETRDGVCPRRRADAVEPVARSLCPAARPRRR